MEINSNIRTGTGEALRKRMAALGIREEDIEEKFIHSSGPGGQKVNKTSSCVYLKHRPTGIEVKCSQERSQSMNRFFARRILADKIDFLKNREKSEIQQRAEKIRRQKRQRSKRSKERLLEKKRRNTEKKDNRKPPGDY